MAKWNREKMLMVLTAALLLAVSIQGILLGKVLWNAPDEGMQTNDSRKIPGLTQLWTKPDADFPTFGYSTGTNRWDPFAELDRMQQEQRRPKDRRPFAEQLREHRKHRERRERVQQEIQRVKPSR